MKKLTSIICLLYIPPVLVIATSLLENRGFYAWSGINTGFGTGLVGATSGLVYSNILRLLKAVKIADPLKIKIHNEQLKLLSNTTNAVALGLFGFALLDVVRDHQLSALSGAIILVLAVFIHRVAQKILECALPDNNLKPST